MSVNETRNGEIRFYFILFDFFLGCLEWTTFQFISMEKISSHVQVVLQARLQNEFNLHVKKPLDTNYNGRVTSYKKIAKGL